MRILTTSLFCALAIAGATAQGYVRPAARGVSVGVNPSGTKVFGYDGRSGEESQLTWSFDVATKVTSTYPDDSQSFIAPEGQLMWLSSSGAGVGTFRDNEWATTVKDGSGTEVDDYPLNTACLWRDGVRINLDHNRWEDAAEFKGQDGSLPSAGNGFYAMRMTEDESVIVGYLKAFTYMLPVRWDRNADGSYTSTMLPRKTGEFFYYWVGASADCSRVILNTAQTEGFSFIWDGNSDPWVFKYTEEGSSITNPYLTALSPDGKHAIMNCNRDGLPAHGVYDFETGTVRWIPIPEGASSTNWFAANVLTDNGDGFMCDYNYQLHYFNIDRGINIPFRSYLQAFGDELVAEDTTLPTKALVRMISDDGRTICGNDLKYGLEYTGWIVRLPEKQPLLFALSDCSAFYSSPESVTIKWKNPSLPEGSSMTRYIVNLDGNTTTYTDITASDDGYMRIELPCATGTHEISLCAVATDKDGSEWESVIQELNLSVSDTTDLYFFEDLCDSRVDETVMAYIYTHDTFSAVKSTDSAVLNFRLDAGDFYNLTPYWYTCGFSNAEWHSYLESRWFDATEQQGGFYFTWHERNRAINDAIGLDANNRLLVEYTTDGETWTALNESNGKENGDLWKIHVVDLSSLAGKCFRLRFHAIGAGKLACEWRIDYYGIMPESAMYDAPGGLMITEATANKVKLAWKNNRDEYEVSYNYNSPMTYNTNVGNEGRPLYTACDYGPAKLKAFEGKYITAVSTMLYEPEDVEQAQHTKLQAVIFDEQGNELSRGTLSDDAPWYEAGVSISMPIHHISLDTPVKIEPGKTYRVATLITDYAPAMNPVWYFSASDDYIPGTTDLYSDDDLKSWNTISSLYEKSTQEEFNLYGRCIFNIRPCISDEPVVSTIPYCQEQWFYQVYRDGQLLPCGIAYFTQQSVTDQNHDGASYTVRSFRRDGTVSKMSDSVMFHYDGLESIADDKGAVTIHADDCNLYVNGNFDSVAVYNAQGIKVASSRVVGLNKLARGIYFIVTVKDGRYTSTKWMF